MNDLCNENLCFFQNSILTGQLDIKSNEKRSNYSAKHL